MSDSTEVSQSDVEKQGSARFALAIFRLVVGVFFISVFFENLNKGLYSPSGYAGLINYYVGNGQAPQVLKSLMSLMAAHAGVAGPIQGLTEISFGILLLIGLLTRPVALVVLLFLTTLWIAEWGTAWIWELLVPMFVALTLAIGGAGRNWGVDAVLRRKYPSIPLW
jgi:uncharacterized membrane protein YphA (DoxX/SURF4 family)